MKRLLLPCLLVALLSGCRHYTIDSNPQGLRVVINDIEHGVTPIEYSTSADFFYFTVEVYPPNQRQWDAYEQEKQVIVSTFIDGKQHKFINPSDAPSGTILFDFVTKEYPIPTTQEERECDTDLIDRNTEHLRHYTIDSNPQGLRIVINDIEHGVTPIEYSPHFDSSYFTVEVYPPNQRQLEAYEQEKQVIISTFLSGPQSKIVSLEDAPSGTILFDFVTKEYPIPTTQEELDRVINLMDLDAEHLRRIQSK